MILVHRYAYASPLLPQSAKTDSHNSSLFLQDFLIFPTNFTGYFISLVSVFRLQYSEIESLIFFLSLFFSTMSSVFLRVLSWSSIPDKAWASLLLSGFGHLNMSQIIFFF